jgi:suppressor of tumorigenicity protein 13
MGDSDFQPTDEQIEKSQEKYSEAVTAFNENDFEKTIKLCTEGILLNPQSSFLYSKRGQAYLRLEKPNFCISECNRALQLNPDSHAAYKIRGDAYQMLGKNDEAANDFAKAFKLRAANVSIILN